MENEKVKRFISGTITKCHLAEPVKRQGKNGEFEQYTLFMDGMFEDTQELVQMYFNSKFPVKVYEGSEDPIDPKETEQLKFQGRILVTQSEYNGKTFYFLNAVSIEQRLGVDESSSSTSEDDEGNPFLKNPLA